MYVYLNLNGEEECISFSFGCCEYISVGIIFRVMVDKDIFIY